MSDDDDEVEGMAFDRLEQEAKIAQRHLEVLELVCEKEPIGITEL